MLRKAKEKAKEGFHSVQSETKRYLQSRQHKQHGPQGGPGGGHGPRSSRHQATSVSPAFVSFKGVNDDFEAILNDESDFTNQFDKLGEAPDTSPSSIEEERVPPANGGSHQADRNFHINDDSDLFSDPLFSEPKHNVNPSEKSHTNGADLLFDTPMEDPLGLTVSDNHQENEFTATIRETDNTAIPNSDDARNVSDNSVSHLDALNDSTDEALLPESAPKMQDLVRPDSPLFSDDVMVGSANYMEDDRKEDSQLSARILVTQPSNESPQQSRKHVDDKSRADQLGEGEDQQAEEDMNEGELPKPATPDIEELEQTLAVGKISGGQDLFSSEESPFSSLASSYEGDKVLDTMTAATLSHTENTKASHDESDLFEEVVSAVAKEVNGHPTTASEGLATPPRSDTQQQPATYSIDEELEMLLTPKQKPKVSSTAPFGDESGLLPTNVTVDDPLQAGSHPLGPGKESVSSHLDSGVFEQSGNSSTLKSTPERESEDGAHEDDLFPITEDHFKADDDDSTPVPVRRKLIKGASNIEVSQQSKKVLQSTISAPSIVAPDVGKASSSSSPPKKSSTGKVAPPRPAISPKLKHRMIQKQSASSSGQHEEFMARKKIVQPLGQAPHGKDILRDHSPVRAEMGGDSNLISEMNGIPSQALQKGSNASMLSTKSDVSRIPADDLFLDDNIVSPSSDEIENLSSLPQSTVEQSELAETKSDPSEDEETRNYFLYHFLFAGLLYFYYSLNIFPYLSGFFAGFFVLYLTVGSVFIFYVQTVEKEQTGEGKEDRLLEPSREFTELMHVDFDNLRVYKVRHSVNVCVCVSLCVHVCVCVLPLPINERF